MTLSISETPHNPGCGTVRITYGPVTATVEEYFGHLRSFWSDLGRFLDRVENADGKDK